MKLIPRDEEWDLNTETIDKQKHYSGIINIIMSFEENKPPKYGFIFSEVIQNIYVDVLVTTSDMFLVRILAMAKDSHSG